MSKENELIGAEIRRIRKEKGISQGKLGELIETKQTNVSQLENGLLNPSVDYLVNVCKALEINLKELLSNI